MYFKLYFTILALASTQQVQSGTIVPSLDEECKNDPAKVVNLMLELPPIDPSVLPDGENNVEALVEKLKTATSAMQAPVIGHLHARVFPEFEITSFWIVNRIGVRNVPCSLVPFITEFGGIFKVRKEAIVRLTYIGEAEHIYEEEKPETPMDPVPQWGVTKIMAKEVWPYSRGDDIVVAGIDTGVRGTHESLRNNYRGDDFSWCDGFKNSSVEGPNDGHGHGTHTMGSMVGSGGYGVAPGAKWIACKGCDDKGGCSEIPLLTCGEWVMCPYKVNEDGSKTPDCKKKPDVVNNSWGGKSFLNTDDFYNGVIENWHRAGIIPVFAAGNDGPACMSLGYPGDQANVISVGATDKDDKVAVFSSRGPTTKQTIKPDIAAPGAKIVSAWIKSDSSYSTLSGTSMAAPHVVGAVALLLAKSKTAEGRPNFETVRKALTSGPFHPTGITRFQTCMCPSASNYFCNPQEKTEVPNNLFGYGRIDVQNAFQSVVVKTI